MSGNRNKTIRYHYSSSAQLNLSVLNLDVHNLHLKIVHQTPEIQAYKVKIYSAPKTRGFEKWPSHDLYHYALSKALLNFNFQFLTFEENMNHGDRPDYTNIIKMW